MLLNLPEVFFVVGGRHTEILDIIQRIIFNVIDPELTYHLKMNIPLGYLKYMLIIIIFFFCRDCFGFWVCFFFNRKYCYTDIQPAIFFYIGTVAMPTSSLVWTEIFFPSSKFAAILRANPNLLLTPRCRQSNSIFRVDNRYSIRINSHIYKHTQW